VNVGKVCERFEGGAVFDNVILLKKLRPNWFLAVNVYLLIIGNVG